MGAEASSAQDIPSPCGLDPTGTADGKPVALSYFSCWTLEKNSDWNADSLEQFQTEVAAIVRETRKHPSIIAYVVSYGNALRGVLVVVKSIH